MSAKTTTEYFCDRCGEGIGATKPDENLFVEAHKNGEWAMDFSHKWSHFCDPCRLSVIAFFKSEGKQ